jgi:hypothetical protein
MLVFSGVMLGHWMAAFVTWAYAQRSGLMRLLWNILAAPLIHLTGSLTIQYFWAIATINSALWAAAATYLVARFRTP